MTTIPLSVISAVESLVADLSQRRFAAIERDGRIGRLTAQELQRAIDEYGRTLIPLPPEARTLFDVYPLEGKPNAWGIDVPLWTSEEGRSDLTLAVTALDTCGVVKLEIDDIHVP